MTRVIPLLAASLLLAIPSISYAGLIRVVAEGTLTSFIDPDGLLSISEPPAGTRIRMEITYSEDLRPIDAGNGTVYPNLGTAFFVGDQEIGPFGSGVMAVSDDDPLDPSGVDRLLVRSQNRIFLDPACTQSDCPRNVEDYFIGLNDNTAEALSSEAITDIPWQLDAWPSISVLEYEFSFQENSGSPEEDLAEVTADIDTLSATIVPLPASVLLLGSALGALGLTRRWLSRLPRR